MDYKSNSNLLNVAYDAKFIPVLSNNVSVNSTDMLKPNLKLSLIW